jgi:hypothetical protein
MVGRTARFTGWEAELFGGQPAPALPRAGVAVFMLVSGLVTLVVCGAPLLAALAGGGPPDRMDSYTTMVTYALDLAIITPSPVS